MDRPSDDVIPHAGKHKRQNVANMRSSISQLQKTIAGELSMRLLAGFQTWHDLLCGKRMKMTTQ